MKLKILLTIIICLAVITAGIMLGSTMISFGDVAGILLSKLFGRSYSADASLVSIVLNIRLPRTLLAFIVGGALAASGTVMQSTLRNTLASSYTLGVSAGAALGAGICIVTGLSLPLIGRFTLPLVGLVFALVSTFASIAFATRMDKQMENNTVILVGMVFSLFLNSLITLIIAFYRERGQRLVLWQMGSFSMKEWSNVLILLPIAVAGIVFLCSKSRELDIMTFGEETAKAIGVDLVKQKWLLLCVAAGLTGSAVAFVGVIGFIDLIAPHIVRRLFGAQHRFVVPVSALFGGAFMVVCDLIARTVVSPSELPVGAVSALFGAPFFCYVYFKRKKGVL